MNRRGVELMRNAIDKGTWDRNRHKLFPEDKIHGVYPLTKGHQNRGTQQPKCAGYSSRGRRGLYEAGLSLLMRQSYDSWTTARRQIL